MRFKEANIKCKFIIKQAKTSSWINYVSKINSHTSIKSVWKKIGKIKGKSNQPATSPDGIHYQFLTHLTEDFFENFTPNIQQYLSGSLGKTFLHGPFRPNQLPADSSQKLSLQDHGTNDE